MMYKKFFLSIFLSLTLLFAFVPAITPVQADKYGLDATADRADLKIKEDVPTLAGNIIGTALSLISVIFFILMVYGGFLWMTAHGDEGQVKKAQETIIAAVIGIIVILAAYAITNFVTTSVISSNNAQNGNGNVINFETPIDVEASFAEQQACDAAGGLWLDGECLNS